MNVSRYNQSMSLLEIDLDWINTERIQALSAIITAAVTVLLFRLATKQLR